MAGSSIGRTPGFGPGGRRFDPCPASKPRHERDPGPRQINGTWENEAKTTHTFASDGTFVVETAYSFSGDPWAMGTYTFDGSILTLDTNDEVEYGVCNLKIGRYEVTLSDSDTMSWEPIEDDCRMRTVTATRSPWARVEED